MNFMSEMRSTSKEVFSKIGIFINKPAVKYTNIGAVVISAAATYFAWVVEGVEGYSISKNYAEMCNARNNINIALSNAVDKKIENDESIGLMDLSEFYNYPVAEVPQFTEENCNAKTKLGKFVNDWMTNSRVLKETISDFDFTWTTDSTLIWAETHGVLDDEVLDAINEHTAAVDKYNDAIMKAKRFKEIEAKVCTIIGVPCTLIVTVIGALSAVAGL